MLRRSLVIARRLTFAVVLLVPAVASAQSYPGGQPTPPPQVRGERFFRGDEGMARTGLDILWIIAIALALLCLGLLVRRLTRRSAPGEA